MCGGLGTIFTALIIRISGGSITYGGSDTMSNSRGTVLLGDGSGGVTGYGLIGSKKGRAAAAGNHYCRQRDHPGDVEFVCDASWHVSVRVGEIAEASAGAAAR